MPNQIDSTGLQIKTINEITADLVAALQAAYGSDINTDQNSPDGQLINIFAQTTEDQLELLLSVYNSFTIDAAFGVLLDQRVAINGMARNPGTHTITNVTVTTTGAVNLVGLDALANDPTAVVFTVADGNGVLYQLQTSVSIVSSGAHILVFQAADTGIIQPVQNTITNVVTLVTEVSAVNNPSAATSIGTNEETDAELRIRHASSFFLASTGPADAIEAALLAIPDVTDAFVAENDTNSPVSGVPAFSIWCIVEGGTDAEVGTAIYSKKAPGCGMKGSSTYVVNRPNGTTFTAKFDRAIDEDLYIQFTITPKKPGISFDATALKAALVADLTYRLNQPATIGDVVIAMAAIAPNGILSVVGVSSDGMSYVDILQPTDYQHKFALATARIAITIP